MPHLDANKVTETQNSGKQQQIPRCRCLDCRQTPNTKEASMCQTSIIFELCLEPHTKKVRLKKKCLRGVNSKVNPVPRDCEASKGFLATPAPAPSPSIDRPDSPIQKPSRSSLRFVSCISQCQNTKHPPKHPLNT